MGTATSPVNRASTGSKPSAVGSIRWLVVPILMLGSVCMYIVRTNISVAVIDMYPCPLSGPCPKETLHNRASALAGLYYGYAASQMPAAYIANRFDAKWLLVAAVAGWVAFTLLTVVAQPSMPAMVATRAALGLACGANYASVIAIVNQWVPPNEFSRAWGMVSSGEPVGTILALTGGSFLQARWGWQAVFYASAGITAVYLLLLVFLVTATPEGHPMARPEEVPPGPCPAPSVPGALPARAMPSACEGMDTPAPQPRQQKPPKPALPPGQPSWVPPPIPPAHPAQVQYIRATRRRLEKDRRVPWLSFLTNTAALATFTAIFTPDYGYYVIISWLPNYFSHNFNGIDITKAGLFSMPPYLAIWALCILSGAYADALASVGTPLLRVRWLCQTVGSSLPAALFCLLSLDIIRTDKYCALTIITVAQGLSAFTSGGGYWPNFSDLSHAYSSHILSIGNSLAATSGILGNLLTGAILGGNENNYELVFGVVAGILCFGNMVFVLFGKAHDQNFEQYLPPIKRSMSEAHIQSSSL
eukprot:gene12547-2290_t